MDQPLHYLTASGLMQLLEAGDLTSEALTRPCSNELNDITRPSTPSSTWTRKGPLASPEADRKRQAGEPCGPLHGLPMTVKDTWEVPGLGCCAGAPVLSGYRPEQPADVIRRLQDAGAIIIGKTNVPYYASDIQTYNRVYGTSYNPWNRDHTPAGLPVVPPRPWPVA